VATPRRLTPKTKLTHYHDSSARASSFLESGRGGREGGGGRD
jgi:hypothetical protein